MVNWALAAAADFGALSRTFSSISTVLSSESLVFRPSKLDLHLAVGGGLGHRDLAVQRGGVEVAALETGEELVVGIEGFQDVALLFEQLGLAEAGLRRRTARTG